MQDLCETWIDLAFVIAFVLRDLLDHETIRLRNENDRAFRRGIVESVSDFSQPIEVLMILPQRSNR